MAWIAASRYVQIFQGISVISSGWERARGVRLILAGDSISEPWVPDIRAYGVNFLEGFAKDWMASRHGEADCSGDVEPREFRHRVISRAGTR